MRERTSTERTGDELHARIAELEAAVAAESARADAEHARAEALLAERDRLRAAYQQAQIDLELMRRRIFVAKAERVDTRQLELEFQSKKAELAELARRLGQPDPSTTPAAPPKERAKPKGRRAVRAMTTQTEERCEVLDPELEGKAERVGFQATIRLAVPKPIRFAVPEPVRFAVPLRIR